MNIMTNTTNNELTQPLLAEKGGAELRALLCGPKAPKTSRGREAQTAKVRPELLQIFRGITPAEILELDPTNTLVRKLMCQVWGREYLMSSQGDRVVQEMTDFESMCRKYILLCEVALMGKNLLGEKSNA